MTGQERLLKTMGGRKGAKGNQEMPGGPKTVIAATAAEGAWEGQPGLLQRV